MTATCFNLDLGHRYALYHGDCVQVLPGLPDSSIGLSVSSWPFSDQYAYSDSIADFGNCDGDAEFFQQMDYLIPELMRVTIPGRFACVHAKDRIVYGTKNNGFRKLSRFSDKCADAMERHGWLFFGRITIATDPVRENAQTNNLPFGQRHPDGSYTGLQEDASRYGAGLPEYLLLFRKPHTQRATGGQRSDVPIDSLRPEYGYQIPRWQIDANSLWRSNGRAQLPYEAKGYDYHAHVAYLQMLDERKQLGRANGEPIPTDHPAVWWDIQRTRTLNSNLVRKEQDDEKHICPLQLDIVERAVARFSNPDDVVLDYFAGLGTVPAIALDMGRRGVGIELKQSYYEVASRYLREREIAQGQLTLFEEVEL
ncbi:MAG: hypothetical protein IPP13_22490 [Kouleothrix sp.]|jgi:DNA modification methylase|nr:hypothetical protein [Kouleothrix sp.]